jgi:hypothetical protein
MSMPAATPAVAVGAGGRLVCCMHAGTEALCRHLVHALVIKCRVCMMAAIMNLVHFLLASLQCNIFMCPCMTKSRLSSTDVGGMVNMLALTEMAFPRASRFAKLNL